MRKRNFHSTWTITLFLFTTSICAFALEEGIVKNANGDYIITFRSESGQMIQWLWEPATKIDPMVSSKFRRRSKPESLVYSYKITNGKKSAQDLGVIRFVASNTISSTQVVPTGWDGLMKQDWGRSSGVIVAWSFDTDGGLKPGSHQGDFSFESNDLPGVGRMELIGVAPVPSIQQILPDGPLSEDMSELSPVRQQFTDLEANEFVPRNTAIPKIPVSTPYDGAAVLDALRAHITKDIADLKLIEPTLASELDRALQAAADAIRRDSIKAAREHLHDAFKLVHKAHPDLERDGWDDEGDDQSNGKSAKVHPVDRLAARVIAFDIKYVEKRLDKSGDTSGSPGVPSPPAN